MRSCPVDDCGLSHMPDAARSGLGAAISMTSTLAMRCVGSPTFCGCTRRTCACCKLLGCQRSSCIGAIVSPSLSWQRLELSVLGAGRLGMRSCACVLACFLFLRRRWMVPLSIAFSCWCGTLMRLVGTTLDGAVRGVRRLVRSGGGVAGNEQWIERLLSSLGAR